MSKKKKIFNPSIESVDPPATTDSVRSRLAATTATADEKKRKYTPLLERHDLGQPTNIVLPGDGINHTTVTEAQPQFINAPVEQVIENNNSYIVLGTDRPSDLSSGWGGKGAQGANMIDIVVGRMAGAREGAGPKNNESVNNSFIADAARIYISQKTDVDKNFGLPPGQVGNSVARSAVAIKADGVRLIGRQGVKIITGAARDSNENSSVGDALLLAPPIDLIAGASDEPREIPGTVLNPQKETINGLQPILLGENTLDALTDLGQIVDEVWSALFSLAMIQTSFNGVIGALPIPPLQAAALATTTATLTSVINALFHTRANKVMWEVNHLYPFGYKYICSRNVNST